MALPVLFADIGVAAGVACNHTERGGVVLPQDLLGSLCQC